MMKLNNNPIGVFDSGIGGATVLKEIVKKMPNEKYIYYSDSKNNPYGDKTDNEIMNFCEEIIDFFIEQNCKAIVVACNTASAKASGKLRRKYKDKIIIAIEPAYKMVYDYAYNKPTLIMATEGTIKSDKFNNLYNKYNNKHTYLLPCKGLADIIEEGNPNKIESYLKENLFPYENKVENVVLGCTHYELIQDKIIKVLGDVMFFNGAKGVANNLWKILLENDMLTGNTERKKISFFDSSNSEYKKERFFKYLDDKKDYLYNQD